MRIYGFLAPRRSEDGHGPTSGPCIVLNELQTSARPIDRTSPCAAYGARARQAGKRINLTCEQSAAADLFFCSLMNMACSRAASVSDNLSGYKITRLVQEVIERLIFFLDCHREGEVMKLRGEIMPYLVCSSFFSRNAPPWLKMNGQ
jgi:hypothetical protein